MTYNFEIKTIMVMLFTAILLTISMPSVAQQSSLKGHDTQQPLDVTAENLEVRPKEGWAILKGLVQVKQGGLLMNAAEMRVFYDKDSIAENPEIIRLDAKGGIKFTSSSESVTADRAIYDVEKRFVTMLGNVVVKRGSNILKGNRLELDLETGLTKIDGASAKTGKKGRVKATFTLPKKK